MFARGDAVRRGELPASTFPANVLFTIRVYVSKLREPVASATTAARLGAPVLGGGYRRRPDMPSISPLLVKDCMTR